MVYSHSNGFELNPMVFETISQHDVLVDVISILIQRHLKLPRTLSAVLLFVITCIEHGQLNFRHHFNKLPIDTRVEFYSMICTACSHYSFTDSDEENAQSLQNEVMRHVLRLLELFLDLIDDMEHQRNYVVAILANHISRILSSENFVMIHQDPAVMDSAMAVFSDILGKAQKPLSLKDAPKLFEYLIHTQVHSPIAMQILLRLSNEESVSMEAPLSFPPLSFFTTTLKSIVPMTSLCSMRLLQQFLKNPRFVSSITEVRQESACIVLERLTC